MKKILVARSMYEHMPENLASEFVEQIGAQGNVRMERIVSHGQSSPPGFWYDQEEYEWVILLKGAAAIRFEKCDHVVELTEGMYLQIPAHTKHRVEWTKVNTETIWLAIYVG